MLVRTNKESEEIFEFFVSLIKDSKLQKVCKELYFYEDFWTHVGSIGHHHSFYGGLLLHTLEVADNALHTCKKFPQSNKDILITASLWHDLAKIWDYEQTTDGLWKKADFYHKIHHVSGSTAEFTAMAVKHGIDRETIQKIQHCIVSHHLTKDWGSPRTPESLEAVIMHQADMLSATFPKNKQKLK